MMAKCTFWYWLTHVVLDKVQITHHKMVVVVVYPNPHSYANPNPAMSDCYIQACTILAGSCSGFSTVSRVRVRIKVMVMDRCVKGLK